jgi:hypothetical protein
MPGNGVATLNRVIDQAMASRPSHPSVAAATLGSRRRVEADRATRPPAANSQARVGREKNAHGAEPAVSRSDRESDPAPASASAATAPAEDRVRSRRPARNTTSSSSGHSR